MLTANVTGSNDSTSASKEFTIIIGPRILQVEITTKSLSNGTIGTAYSDSISTNVSGVTFSLVSGTLPAGLNLNASTGAITGTPTTAGTSRFRIGATNGQTTATQDLSITISFAPVTINIMNSELYAATVDISYRAELYANVSDSRYFLTACSCHQQPGQYQARPGHPALTLSRLPLNTDRKASGRHLRL